jgi:hypothetical protein
MPSLLSSMFLDMSFRVIIQGFNVNGFIGELLGTSPIVGRHTSIIHLSKTPNGLIGSKYVWAHPDMVPWGNVLPVQCPRCFSYRSFGQRLMGVGAATSMSFSCNGLFKGQTCGKVITFPKPLQVKNLPKSDWIALPWP